MNADFVKLSLLEQYLINSSLKTKLDSLSKCVNHMHEINVLHFEELSI